MSRDIKNVITGVITGAGVAIIILLSLCYQQAYAGDLFYKGDIVVDSVDITIDAGDNEAKMYGVYQLVNRGDKETEVNLQFVQPTVSVKVGDEELSNPVVFKPGERKSINVECKLNLSGEKTKRLYFDPTLLFDGKPNSNPAKSVLIKVILPEGVRMLTSANQEPAEEGFEEGRKFYLWKGSDIYPLPLSIKWSTLKLELKVSKTATPRVITEPNQTIKVEITIENMGNKTIHDIVLTDQYLISHFEPVQPIDEFTQKEGILAWVKRIDSLEPRKTEKFTYSLKYIGFSPGSYKFELRPCIVTVNGNLVAQSDKVGIEQIGKVIPTSKEDAEGAEAPTKPKTIEVHYPSIPVICSILLIIAVIGGYFIWKRRKRGRGGDLFT